MQHTKVWQVNQPWAPKLSEGFVTTTVSTAAGSQSMTTALNMQFVYPDNTLAVIRPMSPPYDSFAIVIIIPKLGMFSDQAMTGLSVLSALCALIPYCLALCGCTVLCLTHSMAHRSSSRIRNSSGSSKIAQATNSTAPAAPRGRRDSVGMAIINDIRNEAFEDEIVKEPKASMFGRTTTNLFKRLGSTRSSKASFTK